MAGHVLFEQVWKRFQRGMTHDSLRDLVPSMMRRLTKGGGAPSQREDNGFWAVRDVSFEVRPGQALGIIGGNGAGKSTTLKLLTKILTPSQGRAVLTGRVGALIEVSAGFHPDLTGRENVYLQGAIMGMPIQLIRERFDEIVEFSGVSAFIDTPIKRYSSGMNARLGFAIAAHLEPDVLIIDEVLSVGDAEFQGRAFGRIKELVRAEIPVVIVSHQLDRVLELCTECILLRKGEVAFRGDPGAAIRAYLEGSQTVSTAGAAAPPSSVGVAFTGMTPVSPNPVPSGGECTVTVSGHLAGESVRAGIGLTLIVFDLMHHRRIYWTSFGALGLLPNAAGPFERTVRFRANLPEGLYRVEAEVWDEEIERPVGESIGHVFQVINSTGSHGSHQLMFVPE